MNPIMHRIGDALMNGFFFGVGLILAGAFMRVALHLGFCG